MAPLATAAVGVFCYALHGVLGDVAVFLPFTLAVLGTAWVGGLGPGLLATALGTVLPLFLFMAPKFSFATADVRETLAAVLFIVTGVSISVVCDSLHAARRTAELQQTQRRAEQDRVVATLESITDAFTQLDRDWRIVFVNAEAERLTGRTRSELVGKSHWAEFPTVAGTNLETEYRRAVSEKVTVEFEHYFAPVNRWFAVKGDPTPDGGLAIFFRDITEQKGQREALATSEERFRLAADAVNGIIYDYDVATGHVERTRGVSEVLGYQLAEVPPTAAWWREQIHPDDIQQADDIQQELKKVSGNAMLTEYRVRHKDGRWLHVEDRVVLVRGKDGKPVRTVGCTTDITDRKRAEAALRASEENYHALFAASPVPFFVLSPEPPDFTFLAANDAYLAATHTTRESLIGRKVFDVFTDDPSRPAANGPDQFRASLARVMESKRPDALPRTRYDIPHPEGGFEERWWLAISAPVMDASGRVTAIIHQVTDATEQHLADVAEQEVQERQAFLLELIDVLSRLSDPDEIMLAMARRLGERLGLATCLFADVDETHDEVTVHQGWNADGIISLKQTFRLADYLTGEFQRASRAGAVTIISNTAQDPRSTSEPLASVGVGALVAVPFHREGRWTAYLGATDSKPRDWTPDEIALFRDISDRVFPRIERARAEAALRDSEERHRSLFETISQGFSLAEVVRDAAGNAVDWRLLELNPVFEEYSGMSVAECVGRTAADVFGEVDQDWLAVYDRVVRDRKAERREAWFGPIGRWVGVNVYPATGDRFTVLYEDISELKRSEERQAFLLNLSDALRPLTDPVAIQGAATRLLGEHLGVDRAYYAEIDMALDVAAIHHCYTRGGDLPSLVGSYRVADFAWIIPLLQRGVASAISDVLASPLIPDADQPAMAAARIAALVGVPLVTQGVLVGALCITHLAPHAWTDTEVELVKETAERTWAAVERTEAEERLRQSEARFSVALKNSRILVCTMDADLRYSWLYNPHPAFKSVDVLGRRDDELLPPEQAAPLTAIKLDVLTSGVGRRAEVAVVINGEMAVYDLTVEPLRDGTGGVVGLTLAAMEITDRKREEAALKISEVRYRRLFESAKDGILMLDAHAAKITDANPFMSETLGYSRDEFVGKELWQIGLFKDVEASKAAMLELQEKGYIRYEDLPLETKAGRRINVEFVSNVYGENGESVIQCNVRDITHRRQTEQALTKALVYADDIIATLREPFLVLNVDLRVKTANRSFYDAFHVLKGETEGQFVYDLGNGQWDIPALRTLLDRVLSRSESVHDYEVEHSFPALGRKTMLLNARPFPPDSKHPELILLAVQDVTAIRARSDDLAEADRKKDEFLATLAHELRNPLAPIRNGLHIMKLAGGNPEAVDKSRLMMERQVEQMTHLIDDLMDLARIRGGKIVLQRARLTVSDVVQDAVDASRPLIAERGHALVVDVPPELLYVDGDRTRLAQVFANLLNNAAKYTEAGGRIRVAVERQGGDVVVAVEDNGVGIPAHMLTRVFDRFAQVDYSLEKSQGGLGIGLNIVKKLVEMHNGTVGVASSGPGRGSTFTVRLPVAVGTPTPQAGDEPEEPAAPKSSLRILIVDDNRDGADSLAMMLKMMGNDTRTAYDGMEGVELAGEFRPDVVLCDIGLPKLNGYDACRLIRQQPWGVRSILIAVTGWGQEDDRRRSKEAGFDHHMVKPVDATALMKLLGGSG